MSKSIALKSRQCTPYDMDECTRRSYKLFKISELQKGLVYTLQKKGLCVHHWVTG